MQRGQRLASTPNCVKPVIVLALEAFLADCHEEDGEANKLDDTFHNTQPTRSVSFCLRAMTPHLAVRQEHDRTSSTDLPVAAQLLKSNAALLNQCPYTLAVIKETLRLVPAANNTRRARRTHLHRPHIYPLEHTVGAEILHPTIRRNPRLWPRADEFLPERWLVDPGHELYPNPAAWRPFEHRPRNCIGQTLVYNEMRIALVMTARTFDIKPAYDEWDAMQAANEGPLPKLASWLGISNNPLKTVGGERAYQTEKAGIHPADGYPCRIALCSGIAPW
ncbi:cytochrome P450 [Aspergillus falconensis]